MTDNFLQFVGQLGVMKPATIDEENKNHLKKLEEIIKSEDYLAEEKVDGCHYMMVSCRFFSTEGIEKTNNYPHLRDFFSSLEMFNLILDGEINYPDKTSQFCTRVTGASTDGAISFQNAYAPIHYTVWDMLRTPRGTWLLNEPLWKRRKILEEFYLRYIKGTQLEQYIHLSTTNYQDKQAFYNSIIAAGKEGIVLKRLDSLYIMGKKPMWQWIKLKQKDEADLFISGYDEPTVRYSGNNIENWPYWREVNNILCPVTKYYYMGWLGALQLSGFVRNEVKQICTCSGMDETMREQLSSNKNYYLNKVVKISFMEKTEAGIPRHPRFEQFHESKTPKECTWEILDN